MMYTVTKTCLLFSQNELRPYVKSYIKSVHPCTDLIARFAQQNVLLLRTADIRVGTEEKTPLEQNNSGEKIEAVWCSGADRRSFEASAVPILVYFYIILMVHKYRQPSKERCILKGFWVNP